MSEFAGTERALDQIFSLLPHGWAFLGVNRNGHYGYRATVARIRSMDAADLRQVHGEGVTVPEALQEVVAGLESLKHNT